MRASCDYHPWYPNVDPDFDEWGGELTLHQIADPVPEGVEEPAHYLARVHARDYQARYRARLLKQADALREAKATAYQQIRESRRRLVLLAARFDRAARYLNGACRGCIPYNGIYTRNYWDSVQKPFRVEDFLR
jgi:hypothetical protein